MNARLLCSLCIAYFVSDQVAAYDADPRWGQATVLINDALFVHGGKTDPFNSYSYTAAPNSNDILYLPLSAPFDSSSPPWHLLSIASNSSSSEGPSLSWHTLSAFNTSHVMIFGGQPGPNSPTVLVGVADSVYLLNVQNRFEPSWITEPTSWANEPIRRVHHSAATSPSGSILVVGGEKADDSKIAFSEHYIFYPDIPSFTLLSSDNGPPAITGHASVMLPDSRLLVFGGYSQSTDSLLPFSTIWALDTTQSSPSWSSISVSDSPLPPPRRAFAATAIAGGNVLIHGGSDAVLQNDWADGWILDTTQNPMVWKQVEVLSQLGARRDHFAASYGNQVIFGFGYSNGKASPASLQIYDIELGDFKPGFTPLPPSSTQMQTHPGPSQTSKHPTSTGSSISTSPGVHPTDPADPGNPNNGGGGHPNESKNDKTTAVVVGTVLGVLGLLIVALAGAYYVRRHRRLTDERRFTTLQGSDSDDDGESPHFSSGIPAASFSPDKQTFRSLGVLNSLGLAGVVAAATGTKNARHAPERRDMLADEDTRDFGAWYDGRRRDGTGGSSWSLMSIISPRKRSREPSIAGSTGGASWKEKAEPFTDGVALMRDEESGYAGTSRLQGRRQMSFASTRTYNDPFADPIQEEPLDSYVDEGDTPTQPYLHPLPQQFPTLRTILPVSQGGHLLSPLTERTSQNTLSIHDPPNSVSSHSTSQNSPFDTSSSRVTSRTSLEPPKSPVLFTSSIIGATPTNRPMKRSNSWWARFAHTSFLDRRTSDTSTRGMPEFRDPKPPPRLVAIEESVHSASPEGHSPKSQLSSSSQRDPSSGISRHASRLQGGHNKSLSSVRTADTNAIERIAGMMDVVQLVRSGSRRTVSTGTTASLSIDTRPSSWIHENYGAAGHGDSELVNVASPIEMTDAEALSRHPDHYHPSIQALASSSVPVTSSPTSPSNPGIPPSSGTVAARIQEFERRQSHDRDAPPPGNMKRHEERSKKRTHSMTVNYGLIPRASLYVANPDHVNSSSGDS
ncbi:hypothetical protein D9615_004434 [Tricholomella constricta]|uniref:Galactose oxidase n=1 Tax=Tricholomella constricta TaxID=117010 RepID=A0A8H5HFC6_9AGAR|nr:hypothetical protein D9615_004434 [Tricholomella constricta]